MKKQHTAENPEKTRRATVEGAVVTFFRRVSVGRAKSELRRWWQVKYGSHELAVKAADAWAMQAKIVRAA